MLARSPKRGISSRASPATSSTGRGHEEGQEMTTGTHVGTVVGNTSPHEFRFFLGGFRAKLGDLVSVEMDIPYGDGDAAQNVDVWARIVELDRYNPFLPAEAGQELAEEGLELTDTVLSISRDQIEGKAIVLGYT